MGFMIAAVVILVLFFVFVIKPDTDQTMYWIMLAVIVVVGACFASLVICAVNLGFFCLGAFAGFVVGLLFYNSCLHSLDNSSGVVFYVTVSVCALLLGLVGVWLLDTIFIFATSIIGGYFFVRAFTFVCGHYPNEFTIAKMIREMDYHFEW